MQTDRERGRVSRLQCDVWTCLIRIRPAYETIQRKSSFPSESVTNVNIKPAESLTTAEVWVKVSLKAHSLSLRHAALMDLLSPQEL